MTARKFPVVEVAIPRTKENAAVADAFDIMREVLGRLTSIVDVLLLFDAGGHSVTNAAAVGTEIEAARTTLDFDDAKVDTFRVVAYGASTAGVTYLAVRDVSADVELCRVAIPTSTGRMQGEWTTLPRALSGERSIALVVIGDGAADHTLHNVHLHARTTHFR